MDQDFKFNFDEMLDGPQPENSDATKENNNFASAGHVRNLCFVWPDGRRKFLNYAYLVSGEFEPNNCKIILTFTSDTIMITGIKLDILFVDLFNHFPKQIVCTEHRYNELVKQDLYLVNEIEVIKNE